MSLRVPNDVGIAGLQLLIDALPVMTTLENLALESLNTNFHAADSNRTAPLLLDPLLQLPQLKELFWHIGDLTFPQLAVIKQIQSLRVLSSNFGHWSAEQLSFLSQPPHGLDQLEMLNLALTQISDAHMAALVQLPGITRLDRINSPQLAAFPMLPRLPRLRRLFIHLYQLTHCTGAELEMLASNLRACPELTSLTIYGGDCSEPVAERLLQSIPRLRQLRLLLVEARSLEAISLFEKDVSAAHMAALIQLPGITHIDLVQTVQLDAFRMLPRLPRLQRLGFNLPEFASLARTHWAKLQSTLNACSTVTCLTLFDGYCSEAVGERLLHSLPQLQQLRLVNAVVPSLRFLRWAPFLDDLELVNCSDVRPGHVLALGKVASQLKILGVIDREGLLDEFERQALTPPQAVGLPNLQLFLHEVRAVVDEEEEEEEEGEDDAGAVDDAGKGKEAKRRSWSNEGGRGTASRLDGAAPPPCPAASFAAVASQQRINFLSIANECKSQSCRTEHCGRMTRGCPLPI
jgi:hypothetical protein